MTNEQPLKTVVMTDIAGFTELMRTNEAQTLVLLQSDMDVVRASITDNFGEIVKVAGDGILALFDDPARALVACLDAQKNLKSSTLKHRMAVHTGRVTLADGDVYGDTVNVCSRLEVITTPGAVTASRSTMDLLEVNEVPKPNVRGKVQLKGIKGRVEIGCWGAGAKIPRKLRPWVLIGTISAAVAIAGLTIGWRFSQREALHRVYSKAEQVVPIARRNKEGQDIDQIMDEAMQDIWLERDEYDSVKEKAIEKIDPDSVIKWLQTAPLTDEERHEELNKWEAIKSVVDEGRRIFGPKASVDDIITATFKDRNIDEQSRDLFIEEFRRPN